MASRTKPRVSVSEDWWAVLVGIGLILLVRLGVLGELIAIPWPVFK